MKFFLDFQEGTPLCGVSSFLPERVPSEALKRRDSGVFPDELRKPYTPLSLDFPFTMELIHEADNITRGTAGLVGDLAD